MIIFWIQYFESTDSEVWHHLLNSVDHNATQPQEVLCMLGKWWVLLLQLQRLFPPTLTIQRIHDKELFVEEIQDSFSAYWFKQIRTGCVKDETPEM